MTSINLYDSMYTDDDEDIGMLAINEIYGHLNFDKMSNYVSLMEYNKSFPSNDRNNLSIFHFKGAVSHNISMFRFVCLIVIVISLG